MCPNDTRISCDLPIFFHISQSFTIWYKSLWNRSQRRDTSNEYEWNAKHARTSYRIHSFLSYFSVCVFLSFPLCSCSLQRFVAFLRGTSVCGPHQASASAVIKVVSPLEMCVLCVRSGRWSFSHQHFLARCVSTFTLTSLRCWDEKTNSPYPIIVLPWILNHAPA